ncbi:MAG: hypothetical protein HGB19_11455 [Chlorobiales bacterium]|nr:hypothetical protein [Chlorobiales bacterium]
MLALLVLAGCNEDCPNQTQTTTIEVRNGAFVLNAGGYQQNNATITAYSSDNSATYQNFFEQKIGRKLGDTGNDMLRVGNRLYIVVYKSQTIEVVELPSWKSIKTISMLKDGAESGPRQITEYNGKLFVSCFNDYVAVINTTTLVVENWVAVGTDPEGVVALNGKIYVANSRYGQATASVSVINPTTMTVEDTFDAGNNLGDLEKDSYGDLYAISRGNYSDVPPRLLVIDPVSKAVKKTYDFDAQLIAVKGDSGYVSVGGYDFGLGKFVSKIVAIDVNADTVTNNELIPASKFQNLYGVDVDPVSGDIYCTDSRDFVVSGDVFCFGTNGALKFSFKGGVNPSKVAFYRN